MRTKKPKNANKSIRVVDCSDQNNCFLIKSNKQQEKYCVSKAKIFTSGDIVTVMHVAWHDIFSLSDHFPQAGICISPVILRSKEQMLIFSSSLSINNSISSNATIFKVNV